MSATSRALLVAVTAAYPRLWGCVRKAIRNPLNQASLDEKGFPTLVRIVSRRQKRQWSWQHQHGRLVQSDSASDHGDRSDPSYGGQSDLDHGVRTTWPNSYADDKSGTANHDNSFLRLAASPCPVAWATNFLVSGWNRDVFIASSLPSRHTVNRRRCVFGVHELRRIRHQVGRWRHS